MHDQTETPLPSPTLILSLAVILLLPGCESPVGSGSGAGGESPTTLDHCRVDTENFMVGAD